LFVSISQVIGCEDCLRNDLDCVGWGVKPRFNSNSRIVGTGILFVLVSYFIYPFCICSHVLD